MKARVRETVEIAGMVVMQMGHDHVPDVGGRDPERRQRVDGIERQLAAAQARLFRVEAGIDQDVATVSADQPDEIVEVGRGGVVRVGQQEIHVRSARRHRRIAQRIDFVGISHRSSLFFVAVGQPSAAPRGFGQKQEAAGRFTAMTQRHHNVRLITLPPKPGPANSDPERRPAPRTTWRTSWPGFPIVGAPSTECGNNHDAAGG